MKYFLVSVIIFCLVGILYSLDIPEMVDPDAAKSYRNDPALNRSLSTDLKLKNGKIKLNIYYEKGHDQVARYSKEKLIEYLPSMEKALDKPLDPPNKKINLYGKGAVIKGYEDINSSFIDKYNSPALLYHEFGHLWFGLITSCESWFDQGVVSFLPIALHKAKQLMLSSKEVASIYTSWDFANTKTDDDYPLNNYASLPNYKVYSGILYRKSFKVQYLIFLELGGPDAYFKFLNKLLAKHKNTNEDILNTLNQVKNTDWNKFLSGWVFEGPYNNFNLDSFNDQDLDNLIDVEEHYYGTDKTKVDTDGDGYSDCWEIQNGLDPLDKNSKGDPDIPAVDGAVDTISFKPTKRVQGTQERVTASSSIGLLEIFTYQNKAFMRAYFIQKEKKRVPHTIHLKNLNGQNYWIQSNDMRDIYIAEFKDGTPYKDWTTSKISSQNIKMSDGDVFECEFIPSDFSLDNEFALSYHSGGYKNNESIWNSDNIESGVIYQKRPEIAIDGILKDMESTLNLKRIQQVKENKSYLDFNLKELMAGIKESKLYIGASFYQKNNMKLNSIVTFHIQFPDNKANYWVQFSGKSLVGFAYFKDGTAYKDWTGLYSIRKEIKSIRLDADEGLEAMIPLDVFTEISDKNKMRIRIILSGTKDNQQIWDAESSDFLEITRDND